MLAQPRETKQNPRFRNDSFERPLVGIHTMRLRILISAPGSTASIDTKRVSSISGLPPTMDSTAPLVMPFSLELKRQPATLLRQRKHSRMPLRSIPDPFSSESVTPLRYPKPAAVKTLHRNTRELWQQILQRRVV